MNQHSIPALARVLTFIPSRRDVLRSLAGAAVGLTVLHAPDTGEAKKNRKHKPRKPKLRRNEFGCVDVGGNCLGNSANCCSGICEGKKPKKGKKDSSVCVAHDTAGICFADTDTSTVGMNVPCHADNDLCFCVRTTGNAGFCGDFSSSSEPPGSCQECCKDSDYQTDLGPERRVLSSVASAPRPVLTRAAGPAFAPARKERAEWRRRAPRGHAGFDRRAELDSAGG
jgi:hypothetical protein